MAFKQSRAVIPTFKKKAENREIFGLFSFYVLSVRFFFHTSCFSRIFLLLLRSKKDYL